MALNHIITTMTKITLILKDKSHEVPIKVNMNRLSPSFVYETMEKVFGEEYCETLSYGKQEKRILNGMTINVPNVELCLDIINRKPFKFTTVLELYEYMKCDEYFAINYTDWECDNLVVDEKDHDVIMYIAETVKRLQVFFSEYRYKQPPNDSKEFFIIQYIREMYDAPALRPEYTESDLQYPTMSNIQPQYGYSLIIEWLKSAVLKAKGINNRTSYKYVNVVCDLDNNPTYLHGVFIMGFFEGRKDVVEWFVKSGIRFDYSSHGIKFAIQHGHKEMLDVMKQTSHRLCY